ncbi:MAG: hypothetical protein J6S57_02000 [Alphaproteobacteria bacterium]|nr:hypothetical protein [Alphaproteobacteria bacterium]
MKRFSAPLKFDAHFFLTTYCNAYCSHCLMSAGPHQQKKFMNVDDVIFYLNEFSKDSNFSGGVGFNGGEVMTAYKEYSTTYIPRILQECINRNYRIDIRTNSLWTADETINHTIWESLTNLDFSKYTEKIKISLSIDQFHANEEANAKLISKICHYDLSGIDCPTNLNPLRDHFEFDAYLIPDNYNDDKDQKAVYVRLVNLLKLLANKYNIEFDEMDDDLIPQKYNTGCYLNKIPFMVECHSLGQWGRARESGIGNQSQDEHISGQFNIIQKSVYAPDKNACVKSEHRHFHVAFFDGTADFIVPVEKITPGVPYRTSKKCKPWAKLYPEMVAHLQTRFDALKKEYPQITPNTVNLPYLQEVLAPNKTR